MSPPQKTPPSDSERAIFGGGCFWCTEAIFRDLKGVQQVIPGYAGGNVENPTYRQVCTGTTGHAEVIQITFDPRIVSFEKLLEIFFCTHDPTSLNRQGNDVGTQYRSAIFPQNEQQLQIAEKFIEALNASGAFSSSIVTTIEPGQSFYPAEEYHHDYFSRNGSAPYCQMVIQPKLDKFRKLFAEQQKSS